MLPNSRENRISTLSSDRVHRPSSGGDRIFCTHERWNDTAFTQDAVYAEHLFAQDGVWSAIALGRRIQDIVTSSTWVREALDSRSSAAVSNATFTRSRLRGES